MPAANPRRRRVLADAAIALLAEHGAHGLTHRSVERRADQPAGTASNYFRNREALLVAAAERVLELHMADVAAATSAGGAGAAGPRPEDRHEWSADELADLLAHSLWEAATTYRERYLAAVELQLAARGYPALADSLSALLGDAVASSRQLHVTMGTPVSPEAVRTLSDMYIGALFTLVAQPVEQLDRTAVHNLATSMVRGAIQLDTST
ncbi:TetR family transcriptional regulator [Spiractinospora alimapuensis]|uniref:TetR/AcrR family transcriptional regulator n=1 Tax=Spiractinospora alimapuensis TaxID=2820884 RepID=UPI001F28EB59|nr:TetR family transcriptional regulator [Spiractinospora alimapuensis]QVQ53844.1 TetR family transcriptional regulator [Spiractinospora alimapuensis]